MLEMLWPMWNEGLPCLFLLLSQAAWQTVAFRSGEWLVEVHRCWVPLNDRELPAWQNSCSHTRWRYLLRRYLKLPVVVIWVRCPHLKQDFQAAALQQLSSRHVWRRRTWDAKARRVLAVRLENQPTRVPYKQGFCAQLHIRLIAQGNLEEVRRPIVCDGGMLDGIFQVWRGILAYQCNSNAV